MDVDISQIYGNWDAGYSLDKHTVSSKCLGEATWGLPEFHTERTDAGEALYQLKYRSDKNKAELLGKQLFDSFAGLFPSAQAIIPMPPTKDRRMQPVFEIAKSLADCMNVPVYDSVLIKNCQTAQLKNIDRKREKAAILENVFTCKSLPGEDTRDVLLIDDLYDTGSSLKAATSALRNCQLIDNIFVVVVTRKK